MTLVDFVIIGFALLMAVAGYSRGLIVGALSLLGFAGGALALWAVPRRHVGIGPVIAWGAMFAGFVVYAALSG